MGLEEIEVYIGRQNNTVVWYISIKPIMDLCLEAEICLGSRVEN